MNVFVCIFCTWIKAPTVPNVTSLLSHWNLLISPAPDLTVSLSPKLAALCYLIGNLTFHYLIGLCSSTTKATCSKAQAAATRSPFWKHSLSLSWLKKKNKNVTHLKHKYVSEQEISGCHHTAKACKDGGLISMGCLTLAFMLRGVSKNDLQLKVLVFRCRRKILSPV